MPPVRIIAAAGCLTVGVGDLAFLDLRILPALVAAPEQPARANAPATPNAATPMRKGRGTAAVRIMGPPCAVPRRFHANGGIEAKRPVRL